MYFYLYFQVSELDESIESGMDIGSDDEYQPGITLSGGSSSDDRPGHS